MGAKIKIFVNLAEFPFVQGQTFEVTPEMMEAWQNDGAFIVR